METRAGSPLEVSRVYNIPYYRVKLLCKTGELVARKVGRRSLILFSQVESYIAAQPVTKTPQRKVGEHHAA